MEKGDEEEEAAAILTRHANGELEVEINENALLLLALPLPLLLLLRLAEDESVEIEEQGLRGVQAAAAALMRTGERKPRKRRKSIGAREGGKKVKDTVQINAHISLSKKGKNLFLSPFPLFWRALLVCATPTPSSLQQQP